MSRDKLLEEGCRVFFQLIEEQARKVGVELTDGTPKWLRARAEEPLADFLLATSYMKAKPYQIGTRELLEGGEGDEKSRKSLERQASSWLSDIRKGKPGSY